jgi:hypothetical protein
MRAFTPGRLVRPLADALLVLLAWALVAPSNARAGCSQPGNGPAGRDHLAGFLDPLIVAGSEAPGAPASPAATPARPRPCSGPSCSAPTAPPAAPSVAVTRSVELWACLRAVPVPAEPRPSVFPPLPCDLRPVRRGASVFHPPRPDSAQSAA